MQRAYEPLPTRVYAPARIRRVAPREDEEQIPREPGQEDLAHPRVQWREGLVGVHQDDPKLGPQGLERRISLCETQRRPHGARERIGRRFEVACVQVADRNARLSADAGELAQQGRLAHAAGTEDVEHVEGRFVRGERGSKKVPFGDPSDELPAAFRAQATSSTSSQRHNCCVPITAYPTRWGRMRVPALERGYVD